jgi:hypothetical protein
LKWVISAKNNTKLKTAVVNSSSNSSVESLY